MVGEFGEVQVMDWGLAKELASRPRQLTGDSSEPDDWRRRLDDDHDPASRPRHSESRPRESESRPRQLTGDSSEPDDWRRRLAADENVHHTAAGTIMGTPGYMAPEQARGEPVDARADVFALGSILAAILTGQPAFVGTTINETIAKAANAELADVLSRLDACGTDAELLAIARRCLAALPQDRFADGREVASAVASYRATVEARLRQAETAAAEALVREAEQRKRRRLAVTLGGGIAAVLLIGLGVSLWQGSIARAERNAKAKALEAESTALNAERQAREQATTAELAAKKRLVQVEKGIESLATLFANINPRSEDPNAPALYDRLRANALRMATELDAEAVGDPLAVARLQTILGTVLRNLGESAKAIELLEKAVATRRSLLGETDDSTISTTNRLAAAYASTGRHNEAITGFRFALDHLMKVAGLDHPETRATATDLGHALQAAGQFREALAIFESVHAATLRIYGPENTNTCTASCNLATAKFLAGDVINAIADYERARVVFEGKLGPEHVDTMRILHGLGRAYVRANRMKDAIPLLERVRDVRAAKLGPTHPVTLMVQADLAAAYGQSGRRTEAISLGEKVLAERQAKLGPEHPDTLASMSNLAADYQREGKYADAVRIDEQVLAVRKKTLGPTHLDTLTSMNNLATAYGKLRKHADAIKLYQHAQPIMEKEFGPDHPHTLQLKHNLADTYADAGQLDLAIPLFEKVCEARLKKFGPDDRHTLDSSFLLAKALHKKRDYRRAAGLAEIVYEKRKESLGESAPATLTALGEWASILLDAGDAQAAIKRYEQLHKALLARKRDDPALLTTLHNVGVSYRELGQHAKAIEVLEQAWAERKGMLGAEHVDTLTTQCELGASYSESKKLSKAVELLEPALAGLQKSLGPDHSDTLVAANNLAATYRDSGKLPQAIALFREVHQKRADLLGAEHEDTLTALNNLAGTYQEAGRLPEAIITYDTCRKAYLKNFPRDHPQVLIVTVNLAVALYKSGKPREAMTFLEEAAPLVEKRKFQPAASAPVILSLIRIYDEQERYADAESWRVKWLGHLKSTRGEKSLEVVIESFNLAECRGNQKKWAKAEQTYRDCAASLNKVNPELWTKWLIEARIGQTLMEQKKYAEAEPLLLKAYDNLKKNEKQIPPAQKYRLPEVVDDMIQLYRLMERPDDVKKWVTERKQYPYRTP